MNVVFDAERLRNPASGLGQLCRSLGAALLTERPAGTTVSFIVPRAQLGTFGMEARHIETRWWHRYRAPAAPDVWHATHQDVWIRPPRGVPMVLTIMDLNFLERADYSARRKALRLAAVQRLVDRAAVLSAISAYSAAVIQQHLRVNERPVHVVHLGNALGAVRERLAAPADPRLASLRSGSFFLSLGVLHPKKNLHTLLPVLQRFPERRLVLAGPDNHPYAGDVARQAAALGVGDRVVIPGAVSDAVRRWLYEHCEALLFPSLSEGFGLPIVEAMSLGKPVFAARLTSLPEIGGDAAHYFDSFDADSMAETIRRGLADYTSNPSRRQELVAHAARYSWERAARVYWQLYRDAAGGAPCRRS